MLWHYASGLALYWGTSNILYLGMQIGINQSHWGKEMHEIAARRAAKKAGVNPRRPGQTVRTVRSSSHERPEPVASIRF